MSNQVKKKQVGHRGGAGAIGAVVLPSSGWNDLKIGAGGFVTGLDITSDGSVIVSRTDTFGGYFHDVATGLNRQLITTTGIVSGKRSFFEDISFGGGIVEVRIAPSRPTRFYMMFAGDVWRSDTSGVTWTATGLNFAVIGDIAPNSGPKTFGQKMAVDPVNADVVYVGTYKNGVYYTTDAGAHWTLVSTSDIPVCSTFITEDVVYQYPGHPGICFGTNVSGGRTQTIIIPVYGTGVYRTTNAGGAWTDISSGGPTKVSHGCMATDGIYYASNNSGLTTSALYKYNAGWTDISPGTKTVEDVFIDPSNAARVIAVNSGGAQNLSSNRGGAWVGWSGAHIRLDGGIPWMSWTNENSMTHGASMMDTSGNVWVGEGIGLWKSTDYAGGASPSSGSDLTWTSKSKGIENMSTNYVATALGAKPLLVCWDRSIFVVSDPEVYASTHSPDATQSIRMAWDAEYAVTDNTFIAYIDGWRLASEWIWKSASSGAVASWTNKTAPTGGTIPISDGTSMLKLGGSIAVSTPLNWVVVPSGSALPWYTTDGGTTWTEVNALASMPTSGVTGYGAGYSGAYKCVAADKVNSGTFYLFNWRRTGDGKLPSYTGTQSLWRSTNGGVGWTKMNSADIDTTIVGGSVGGKLHTVFGNVGHLFLAGGAAGGFGDTTPSTNKLSFSSDGGATWTNLANIREPWSVTTGKAAGGNNYPSVYFAGYLTSDGGSTYQWGLYRSVNSAATWGGVVAGGGTGITWTKIGDYPLGWAIGLVDIGASYDVYGLVYAATGGGGFMYRKE